MALLLLLLAAFPLVRGWSFTPTQPYGCHPLQVNWTGGAPPYEFKFIWLRVPSDNSTTWLAANSSLFTLTVDNPTYIDGSTTTMTASAEWPFTPFAGFTRMVIVGSDAGGFATGGTTEVLDVGGPQVGDCAVPPMTNATLQLSTFHDYFTNVSACLEPIVEYEAGIGPGPIAADTIVPGGRSERTWKDAGTFVSPTDFWWITFGPPLNASQEVVFVVGLDNGSMPMAVSPLMTVLPSDYSCPVASNGNNNGVIAGAVVGSVCMALLIAGGVVFCVRRYNIKKRRAAQQVFALAVTRNAAMNTGRARPEEIETVRPEKVEWPGDSKAQWAGEDGAV